MVVVYAGKRIAVIGMARTGLAVAEVMRELGASVVLYDRKPAEELVGELAEAKRLGVDARPATNDVDLTGVDILVPSPGVPANAPVFVEAKRLGVQVLSEIELAYRLSEAPIVAVTGTNGKTTTTMLVGRMMEADGRETYIAGNIAADEARMPLVLAAHRAAPDAVIAAEISTFQLEWISEFRPKVAMLLNVTGDHLDRHATFEEYAALKARIFESQTADDFAVINAENQFAASLADDLSPNPSPSRGGEPVSPSPVRGGESDSPSPWEGVRGRFPHVLRFARTIEVDEGAFLRGDELVVRIGGRETVVCRRSDIRLRGEHNVENVLAAACAAVALGVKPESILRAVREFEPVSHRLEPVAIIGGVEYINNSMCTNVDAAVRSVEAIEKPQIVIAGGKEKGLDYAPLGEAFKLNAKHVVLIGADAAVIQAAAEQAGFHALTRAGSLREAVEIARSLAQPGDAVVLTPACASFDMFDSFEDRGNQFREIVESFGSNTQLSTLNQGWEKGNEEAGEDGAA